MPYKIDISQSTVWRVTFTGIFTSYDLTNLAKEVSELETASPQPPNRLADLRLLKGIEFGYEEVSHFSIQRRLQSLPYRVKTAILVADKIQYGYARMFQQLLNHPQIEVRVFENEKDAFGWLNLYISKKFKQ